MNNPQLFALKQIMCNRQYYYYSY